jgi:hypothetical protein
MTRDILEKKAKDTESLKERIKGEISAEDKFEDIKTIINEEGKEVLVFHDPLHSRESRSIVNYTIFNGRWEFENIDDLDETDPEKCAVRFSPVKDSSKVTIAFKSLKDRVEFMDSIYSDNDLKQVGGGIRLENLANSKIAKTTGGLIGLSLAAYGLYKLLTRDKGKETPERSDPD